MSGAVANLWYVGYILSSSPKSKTQQGVHQMNIISSPLTVNQAVRLVVIENTFMALLNSGRTEFFLNSHGDEVVVSNTSHSLTLTPHCLTGALRLLSHAPERHLVLKFDRTEFGDHFSILEPCLDFTT